MDLLNHYQIDYVPGRFELRLEDNYLHRSHFEIDPPLFKRLCIDLTMQIVSYEMTYGEIDLTNQPSPKADVYTYEHKELKACRFESVRNEFTFTMTYNAFISSEDLTLEVSPHHAKQFAVDCANSIVHYEEMYGTIEL